MSEFEDGGEEGGIDAGDGVAQAFCADGVVDQGDDGLFDEDGAAGVFDVVNGDVAATAAAHHGAKDGRPGEVGKEARMEGIVETVAVLGVIIVNLRVADWNCILNHHFDAGAAEQFGLAEDDAEGAGNTLVLAERLVEKGERMEGRGEI